jgi:hypothetical protein
VTVEVVPGTRERVVAPEMPVKLHNAEFSRTRSRAELKEVLQGNCERAYNREQHGGPVEGAVGWLRGENGRGTDQNGHLQII